LNSTVVAELPEVAVPMVENFNSSLKESSLIWKDYWNKSGVKLDDQFLEPMWYQNLYFLNCDAKLRRHHPFIPQLADE